MFSLATVSKMMFLAACRSIVLLLIFCTVFAASSEIPASADAPHSGTTLNDLAQQFIREHPEARALGYTRWGGAREAVAHPTVVNGSSIADGPLWSMFPPTPAASVNIPVPSHMAAAYIQSAANAAGSTTGNLPSDAQLAAQNGVSALYTANAVNFPLDAAQQAAAQQQAQAIAAGNAAGDTTKDQAASALDHCSKFLINFTSTSGNKWNRIRDSIFVPIGLLLLLPGAVLTQVKSIASAGNPVLGNVNPFEGILRAFVAIFFIPASYLIVNYGIDFSNCITMTIAQEYSRMFGTNMYRDAMCAQIRAFNTRTPAENQGAGQAQNYPTPDVHDTASWEDAHASKIDDPCAGIYDAPADRTDQGMPASVAAGRMITYGANAALTATWNILCAFQMAYLYYLFFAGPVVAGLWVWPTKQLRDAFPNWVEGVITLCFWSLFWNTTVLLMACFRGVDDTGTLIMTALNFLSTSCVKFAFDFSGLVKAAGQEAAKKATEGNKGGAGGGAGGQHTGNGAGQAGARASSHLPADYHVTGIGSDGNLHAVNADGSSMSFDNQTGIWTPDVPAGSQNGTTVEGGMMDSGEGSDSMTSLSAGTVRPVGVDVDLPPLSGGSIDTVLPDGNRLQVWSDEDGKHFAVTTPEGDAVLASGDIDPGANAVQFDIQNADGTENPAVLSITDDPTTMTDTFTFSGPTGTETATFTANADGSEQVTLSANGNVVSDYTLGGAGVDNGLQFDCANGDTLLISDLGNGMSAYSRIDANGAIDTIVAPAGSPVAFGDGGPVVTSSVNGDGNTTVSVAHGDGSAEQFVITDTAAGEHIDYSNSAGMQLSSDITSTVTPDGSSYSLSFSSPDGSPIGTETGSVTYDASGVAIENREFLDVNGTVIGTGFSNGSEQVDTLYTPAGREERTVDPTTGATVTSEYSQQGVLADQHYAYQNGVSEDIVYAPNGSYNSTVLAPDGQTVLATSSATMNADNTQTYTSTANSYDSNGLLIGNNETTAHYAQNGALIDSASTIHDAAGITTGYVQVSQNNEGGYTAIQTDTSGHVVSSETTSFNPSTGVMVDTTKSLSYDASGVQTGSTVVTTSTGSDGQLISQTSSAYTHYGNSDVLTNSQDIQQANGVWTATNTSYEGGSAVSTSSTTVPQYQDSYSDSQTYSDNGTLQVIAVNDPASGASGWMSYDSISQTYSAGTNYGQPEIAISFAAGQQSINVDGTTVTVPQNYQDGTEIPVGTTGNTVTIANTTSGEIVTVRHADQTIDTYSLSNGQMIVNGTVGSFAGWRNLTGRRATPTNIPTLAAVGNAPIQPRPTGEGNEGTIDGTLTEDQNEPADNSSLLMKDGIDEDGEGDAQSLEDFGTGADALYKPGTQSLERQMMDASNHATRPSQLNSLLRKTSINSVNSLPDAIVAATVDQNMATLMAGQGQYAKADELYRSALNVMESYSESDEYRILLDTYANYLSKRGREYEANEYRALMSAQHAGLNREVVRI